MPSHPDPRQLREKRDELKAELARVGDLRPGSLVERYRRCGKSNCHCAAKGSMGHGPLWSLTREVAGKTITVVIPSSAVEQTRQQVAEYKRFRAQAKVLVEPASSYVTHNCGLQRWHRKRRPKKGLQTAFAAEIVSEIEALVGGGAVGRAGKQPGGSSKTREVKLVTTWSAEDRDHQGTPARDAGSVTYSAAIESAATRHTDQTPSEFARRVEREAQGAASTKPSVASSSATAPRKSGTSLTSTSQAPSRSSTSITPRGTSGASPKAIYGAGTDLGEMWAKQRRDELTKASSTHRARRRPWCARRSRRASSSART
jgi:hypothetical protein